MSVLLTHGYFLRDDPAELNVMMPYPPQGLLHIASWLKKHGLDCKVFDSTFETFENLTQYLYELQPQYIGLYVNLMTRMQVLRIMKFIRGSKRFDSTVIFLGGPDTRHHAENYLSAGADYCIVGEGEETTRQLIEDLENNKGKGLHGVKGLAYIEGNNELVLTGEPDLIEPLDKLPFPDFKNVPLDDYFTVWRSHHGYTSLTMSTMRGCPFSCNWCSKAVFGRTCRRRSPVSVVEEIIRLQMLFHPDRYWFVDDVFTLQKEWLKGFAAHLKENHLAIAYECITRADQMDSEVIALLKETGCFRVWIGAESGSQHILDRMDRKVDVQKVREVIIDCKQAGLETGTFIMLGYPGETDFDVLETVRHLKDSQPDHYTITTAYPIPGTVFYDEVGPTMKTPGAWGSYSDRDIKYSRTYKDSYYKHAIRFLHHEMEALKEKGKSPHLRWKHKTISGLSRLFMYIYR